MQRNTANKPKHPPTEEGGGPYREQIYLRLRCGTLERIRQAAYQAYPNHQSASEWLRDAIEAALAKDERKRA